VVADDDEYDDGLAGLSMLLAGDPDFEGGPREGQLHREILIYPIA
jgi:hypothetical protein